MAQVRARRSVRPRDGGGDVAVTSLAVPAGLGDGGDVARATLVVGYEDGCLKQFRLRELLRDVL